MTKNLRRISADINVHSVSSQLSCGGLERPPATSVVQRDLTPFVFSPPEPVVNRVRMSECAAVRQRMSECAADNHGGSDDRKLDKQRW